MDGFQSCGIKKLWGSWQHTAQGVPLSPPALYLAWQSEWAGQHPSPGIMNQEEKVTSCHVRIANMVVGKEGDV